MLRSIMVETGDSAPSVAAMETAIRLARSFAARVHALTCLDERALPSEHIRRMIEEHTHERQARFEERCREAGLECTSDIEVGDPHEAMVHLSRKADLLVIGSAPDPAAQERGYSSAAAAIARDVVRHVLVVREKVPAFKSIVVGYAGRENSCNALQLAAHIAERAGGTVHVATADEDILAAGALVNIAMAYLGAYKVEAVPHQVSEEPTKALLGIVEETKADLIAIGAIRRSKLSMLAFGDTAARILDQSPAAVLICR